MPPIPRPGRKLSPPLVPDCASLSIMPDLMGAGDETSAGQPLATEQGEGRRVASATCICAAKQRYGTRAERGRVRHPRRAPTALQPAPVTPVTVDPIIHGAPLVPSTMPPHTNDG